MSPRERPVLRAWLGLAVSALPCTDEFFGDAQQRPGLIARAEVALKKRLSEYQRQGVMGISKHITVWSYIAGGGKTLKLLLVAKMATDFAPNALVVFVASTHRVAGEFEQAAADIFKPAELMPLRVQSTSDTAVDFGVAWLQSVVDAATTEEVGLLSAVDCVVN